MTAQPLSPTEAAIVARFELAQPAPESWGHSHHWIGTHDHGPVCSACGMRKPEGGDDGLRSALAQALRESTHYAAHADGIARYLLPVVTAWADARAWGRAAEELRAAAGNAALGQDAVLMLLYRADALAADDRTVQR